MFHLHMVSTTYQNKTTHTQQVGSRGNTSELYSEQTILTGGLPFSKSKREYRDNVK
jgi:hypothetical protein